MFMCVFVFGIFMGDKMHTRARIHPYTIQLTDQQQQLQQQQQKITTFTFCIVHGYHNEGYTIISNSTKFEFLTDLLRH